MSATSLNRMPVAERLRMWVDPTIPMPRSFDLACFTQSGAISRLGGDLPFQAVSMGNGSMEVALFLLEGAILGTIPRLEWTYHGMIPRERDDVTRIMGLAEKYWSKIK